MPKVTITEVKNIIPKIKANTFIPIRKCSICKSPIGYRININEENPVVFDPTCACTSYATAVPMTIPCFTEALNIYLLNPEEELNECQKKTCG